MQQNMPLPGCTSTGGCESNSKISLSTSGRQGADGTGTSNPDTYTSDFISGAAVDDALGEMLRRWVENEEQDMRRRRELRQRTAMQQVRRAVPIITIATMAMLAPMDEDGVAAGDTLGTRDGGGERPGSISEAAIITEIRHKSSPTSVKFA
jgi:hypothetical protein